MGSYLQVPKFGKKSIERLESCHWDLQVLFNAVIKEVDCSVICGHRNKEDQDKAVALGHSKAPFPKGKHNSFPSYAVDVAPYPIDWDDTIRFYYFAGWVLAKAKILRNVGEITHNIRWGGNWRGFENGVIDFKKNTFNDLPHFELIPDDGE